MSRDVVYCEDCQVVLDCTDRFCRRCGQDLRPPTKPVDWSFLDRATADQLMGYCAALALPFDQRITVSEFIRYCGIYNVSREAVLAIAPFSVKMAPATKR